MPPPLHNSPALPTWSFQHTPSPPDNRPPVKSPMLPYTTPQSPYCVSQRIFHLPPDREALNSGCPFLQTYDDPPPFRSQAHATLSVAARGKTVKRSRAGKSHSSTSDHPVNVSETKEMPFRYRATARPQPQYWHQAPSSSPPHGQTKLFDASDRPRRAPHQTTTDFSPRYVHSFPTYHTKSLPDSTGLPVTSIRPYRISRSGLNRSNPTGNIP